MTRQDLGMISSFYDASIGETDWDSVLRSLSNRLGNPALLLVSGNPSQGIAFDTYASGISSHDGWSLDVKDGIFDDNKNPGLNPVLDMPLNTLMHRRQLIPDNTFYSSDLIASTVMHAGLSEFHMFAADRQHDHLCAGIIGIDDDVGLPPETLNELETMIPHLGRAMRIRQIVSRERQNADNLESLFNRLSHGLAVVDKFGVILNSNEAFEKILDEEDGLSCVHGKLNFNCQRLRKRFHDVLDEYAYQKYLNEGSTFSVTRSTTLLPYVVRILPSEGWSGLPRASKAAACIVVDNPCVKNKTRVSAETLASAFGLTPAESRVAYLIPFGFNKPQMAKQLNVSVNTIKYHIDNIRSKLGARNTIELVQILSITSIAG